MLSASALFLADTGELSIELDSTDSVRVTSIGGNLSVSASTNGGAFLPVTSIGTVASTNVISINVLGGDDANTIDLSGVTAADFTALISIVADGANGHDTIIGSPDLDDSLIGGNGNDTITSNGGNDTIAGGDGADSILAGTGDDSISAGDGDDSVQGEDGNDTISSGNGQDTVSGGNGNDSVSGFNGQDSLLGDAGDDTLNGDGGTDTIDGGTGNDSILGGEFNDSILGGGGNDTVRGQAGNDSIDGGLGNDSLDGGAGNDNIVGNEGNDSLSGGLGNDSVSGNNGNDTMLGGAGNDSLLGDGPDGASQETGNDLINGQGGNDTLIGGSGQDTLNGGDGSDSVFSGFEVSGPPSTPTAPIQPAFPPPPVGGSSNFGPAIATTVGVPVVGGNAQLTQGVGDFSLVIDVNVAGQFFGGALYDAAGAQGPSNPIFIAGTNASFNGGAFAGFGGITSSFTATTTEAQSTFTSNGLNFALVQTVAPLVSIGNTTMGAVLTQTYTVSNPTGAAVQLGFEREMHNHLFNAGTGFQGFNDGAGRLVLPGGTEVLFETSQTGDAALPVDFVGITGFGGVASPPDRFEIDFIGAIGNVLTDTVVNDANADGFVDAGQNDHYGQNLRNRFNINAGQTITYTTHTIFGSGAPNTIADAPPAPPNVAPVATNDAVIASSGFAVTFDVVSNDTDADGVLDFSTVQISTLPSNGTAVSLGNGLITYTPNAGFFGTDTFTYSVADNNGLRSAPATVTINVLVTDVVGDLLLGGEGDDTIQGNSGNDTINGQAGNDSLFGGGGNDSILGGSGNDTLDGQAGDDTLDGQGGNDLLIGGDGNDTFVMGNGAGGDDFVTGGEGFNQIVVNGTNAADALVVGQSSGRITVTRGAATITADSNMSVQGLTVNALAGDDTVTIQDLSSIACPVLVVVNGGDGNDIITGLGSQIGVIRLGLNGDAGIDSITGSEGDDSINGGTGNDAIHGRAGNDAIAGALGDDILAGGLGHDTIDGGNGNDFVTGQEGDDSMSGGDGNDTLRGFDGNDTLQGQVGDDLLNGMDGNDSILGGVGQDSISGGSGDDTLDGGRNDDTINGNSGNDNIRGDHGHDYIATGTDSDTVNGGDGNDTIIATDGNDLLAGNDGDDRINAGGGNDTVTGGDGNDTLLGGGGSDVLLGGDGEDSINGQDGDDTIAGNQGIDAIIDAVTEIDETFQLPTSITALLDG